MHTLLKAIQSMYSTLGQSKNFLTVKAQAGVLYAPIRISWTEEDRYYDKITIEKLSRLITS